MTLESVAKVTLEWWTLESPAGCDGSPRLSPCRLLTCASAPCARWNGSAEAGWHGERGLRSPAQFLHAADGSCRRLTRGAHVCLEGVGTPRAYEHKPSSVGRGGKGGGGGWATRLFSLSECHEKLLGSGCHGDYKRSAQLTPERGCRVPLPNRSHQKLQKKKQKTKVGSQAHPDPAEARMPGAPMVAV